MGKRSGLFATSRAGFLSSSLGMAQKSVQPARWTPRGAGTRLSYGPRLLIILVWGCASVVRVVLAKSEHKLKKALTSLFSWYIAL
jgi:hypothetical protein